MFDIWAVGRSTYRVVVVGGGGGGGGDREVELSIVFFWVFFILCVLYLHMYNRRTVGLVNGYLFFFFLLQRDVVTWFFFGAASEIADCDGVVMSSEHLARGVSSFLGGCAGVCVQQGLGRVVWVYFRGGGGGLLADCFF